MLPFKFFTNYHFCRGSNFQVDTSRMVTTWAPDWTSAGRRGWCSESVLVITLMIPDTAFSWKSPEPLLSQKGEGT